MFLRRYCRRIVALLLVTLAVAGGGASQGMRYFPETGRGAIHQRALELSSGAVVLYLALQPGYEDLPLLTHLRMAGGARAIVAYVTNGDATPSDDGGTSPIFVAAQRKEEAYNASRLLGATAHFLNLPDPGIVSSREDLLLIWNQDSARARLDRTLRHYRPDVVVVGGDFRGDTVESLRHRLLTELVLRAVHSASRDTVISDTVRLAGWTVRRAYGESGRDGGQPMRAYDRPHRVWKKSFREIAAEAEGEYRTLRFQKMSWMAQGDRRYRVIYHQGRANPPSMLDGLPVIVPPLRALGNSVRRLASRETGGLRTPTLREVSHAVDSVDRFLARNRGSLPPQEIRLLAAWKNGLEELRCSLLGVTVDFTCSDSLTTPLQVIFLKFRGMSSRASGGRNRIVFPGAIKHVWGINESIEHQFEFTPPQEFRIITPEKMEMTVPGSQYGIMQPSMRTRFSFLIMHLDSLRERNFFYRGEVLLRVGPRRTYEILTPFVRAMDNEPLIYRLINISRDGYKGAITITDSSAERLSKPVSLPVKDFVLVDTLQLRLPSPLPPGDYPMTLALSGGAEERFIARSFETMADSRARVGLVTGLKESPVAQGMDRLRLPWKKLDRPADLSEQLASLNVLVLDREAIASVPGLESFAGAIRQWVRGGGHLVIFPQGATPGGETVFVSGASLRNFPQLPPETPVQSDTTLPLLRTPNRIAEADLEGWVVARSFGSIAIAGAQPGQVVIGSDNTPLLAEVHEGEGRVTLVTLDLVSQLMNLHPGAHRLLANILRP